MNNAMCDRRGYVQCNQSDDIIRRRKKKKAKKREERSQLNGSMLDQIRSIEHFSNLETIELIQISSLVRKSSH